MPDLVRIGVRELRRDLADVLDAVEDGARVEIVNRKRGQVRALMVPVTRPAAVPAARTA
jgi:antitoxin (DNA-binding transcriptional repressor) of toxin-antitoxin stability system